MLLSILQALGFVMMPVADFCGGQIYKAGRTYLQQTEHIVLLLLLGGFAPVYIVSLSFVFIGIFYISLIPESVTRRKDEDVDMNANEVDDKNEKIENEKSKKRRSPWRVFTDTNRLFLETIKFMFRYCHVCNNKLDWGR